VTDFWENFYKRPLDEIPWHNTQADWFVELIDSGVIMGDSALDVGCGVGTKSIYLAQHGFSEVVGFDISSQAIKYAKESVEKEGLEDSCSFYSHDANDLSFLTEGKKFDLVLDWAVLHCIPKAERENYINNISERVKKGGLLLLRTFSSDKKQEYFFESTGNSEQKIYMFYKEKIIKLYPEFEIIQTNISKPKTKQNLFFLEVLMRKRS